MNSIRAKAAEECRALTKLQLGFARRVGKLLILQGRFFEGTPTPGVFVKEFVFA
jgi:hypothetical protein